MNTLTLRFDTLQQLKSELSKLPDSAVITDRDGDAVLRSSLHYMLGRYAPYTVTYEAPATPAPLDPSKVRVEITDWEDFRAGDVVVQTPEADGVEGAAFLVERDQPAPEPEPEWALDTLADITVGGNQVRAMRQAFPDSDAGWVTIPGSAWWWDKDVTDVRPLVVIDPATARHEVTVAVHKAHTGNVELTSKIVGAVFLALGIEAP